ncbi:hypothetical protein Cni_G08481 [Canna indica]|uniref:Uncharacterized protein n=1 Tax=Canna indica TaxID=4628 RepID=A0AAQ3K0G9_9LILI|nr:hypothetical protein Cni_G08481 [Canna indica]
MGLLEFPCGRRARQTETVAPQRTKDCKGKRWRRDSSWQPSLVAISEDDIALVGDKAVKFNDRRRKARAKPAGKVIPRPDHRLYGVATLVPAFSPAAFIF